MRSMNRWAVIGSMLCAACGAASSGGADVRAGQVESEASSVTVNGLTVVRPSGWSFANAAEELGEEAELAVLGPPSEGPLRPSVVFFRRVLNDRSQRSHPERLLTAFAVELVQTLSSSEMVVEPEKLEIAGHPGARMTLRVTEAMMDGESDPRTARVYGVVDGDSFWAIYALDSEGGASGEAIEKMVGSLEL